MEKKTLSLEILFYINKYTFKLLECDDYTKKYMVDNPEVFRDSDLLAVINRIRVSGYKQPSLEEFVVELLKGVDPAGKNYVSKDELADGLKK